jgi:hypothetical protein
VEKSSAAGFFGVAQSPKSSNGGTKIMITSFRRVARGISKNFQNFSLSRTLREKAEKSSRFSAIWPIQ